ncbi:MAG: glycosyltransferase [Steroidobacteraceae bacterium]
MVTIASGGDDRNSNRPPLFSIIIGLVSTEDKRRVLQTLEALRQQDGQATYEVVIADRRSDDVSREISTNFPEVRLIAQPPETDLPQLRTAALAATRGEFIVVTEDHCVPTHGWLAAIAEAFAGAPPSAVAVGGCVENGVADTALDWATFLCEYSFFLPPVAEGSSTVLPGMNVAYRRRAFEKIDNSVLTRGFWETTLHPVLLAAGHTFFSSNRIRLLHSKKFSLGLFLRQRYLYSQYFAGIRFARREYLRRAAACLASVLLPPLLLLRMARQARTKHDGIKHFMAALPYLCLFVVVWAVGEMRGYALGAGSALAEIE